MKGRLTSFKGGTLIKICFNFFYFLGTISFAKCLVIGSDIDELHEKFLQGSSLKFIFYSLDFLRGLVLLRTF